MRLKKDARQRFAKLFQARFGNLDQIWSVAREKARVQSRDDYGVLVAAHPEGGYVVLIDRDSTEKNIPRLPAINHT